jgi:hypothetical protein
MLYRELISISSQIHTKRINTRARVCVCVWVWVGGCGCGWVWVWAERRIVEC